MSASHVAEAREAVVDYCPRRWAEPFHDSWCRWIAIIIHRRAGKTTATLNHHIRAATDDEWVSEYLRHHDPSLTDRQLKELLRYRLYGHILPQRNQAKLTSWDMLKYYASFVPGSKPNEAELFVDFPCPKGHVRRVQLFGADNMDKARGAAFSGLSLDEYGQHPPTGFGDVLSKALADHLGYCIWEGTIIGKNQLYQVWKSAQGNPDWWTLWQDVDVSLAQEDDVAIQMLKKAMADDQELVKLGIITQEEYDQEWYLSLEAAVRGNYYGKLMASAQKEGRITRVPHEPALPVDTDWDIGVDDETFIWLTQSLRSREIRVIDCLYGSGHGLDYYLRQLRELAAERGYVYGEHWGPHDMAVREFTTGKSRVQAAKQLGFSFNVCPNTPIADGIAAVRQLLPRCWFDAEKCAAGIEALTQYKKQWDNRLQQFKAQPEHDHHSHAADAFRTRALRDKPTADAKKPPAIAPTFQGPMTGHEWMA